MSLSAVLVDIVAEGNVVLHNRRKWTMRLVAVQKVGKIDLDVKNKRVAF